MVFAVCILLLVTAARSSGFVGISRVDGFLIRSLLPRAQITSFDRRYQNSRARLGAQRSKLVELLHLKRVKHRNRPLNSVEKPLFRAQQIGVALRCKASICANSKMTMRFALGPCSSAEHWRTSRQWHPEHSEPRREVSKPRRQVRLAEMAGGTRGERCGVSGEGRPGSTSRSALRA